MMKRVYNTHMQWEQENEKNVAKYKKNPQRIITSSQIQLNTIFFFFCRETLINPEKKKQSSASWQFPHFTRSVFFFF